jgi:hypothetical protein
MNNLFNNIYSFAVGLIFSRPTRQPLPRPSAQWISSAMIKIIPIFFTAWASAMWRPRPARPGHRASEPLPTDCAPALQRLRDSGRGQPEEGRPSSGHGFCRPGSGCRSQESDDPQEPGRHPGKRGRQPAGTLLPAPVLPGRSAGPVDSVRPGLRLYGAGRYRAGPEALPDGAGYAGP